jgi:hypothetical protein
MCIIRSETRTHTHKQSRNFLYKLLIVVFRIEVFIISIVYIISVNIILYWDIWSYIIKNDIKFSIGMNILIVLLFM